MKKLLLLAAIPAILYGCGGSSGESETVVVTNRGSANLTFIDATTQSVSRTVALPGAEPMYAVFVNKTDRLYVGDRAQNKVHIINPGSFAVEASVDVGRGVFHMWADGQGEQLWVVNDVDNTISVIKLSDRTVRTIALTNKPHDVFVTADGNTAYVSLLVDNAPDKVLRFDARTLAQINEANVGEDPHLYFVERDQKLYVANQEGGLFVFGRDLSSDYQLDLPGAHGIFPSHDGRWVFMTNLPGRQMYSLNASSRTLNGPALDVSVNTPHNVVSTTDSTRLFVSHSGPAANQVTTYKVDASGRLSADKALTAGTNPFGIAAYRR
jgi:DNA-binding beta-propeller fold protein YncE